MCSFVSFVVKALGFSAAHCRCPSARPPPPMALLLKTKAKVPFERPVKRLSRPLFRVFHMPNRVFFNLRLFCFQRATTRHTSAWLSNVVLYHLFAFKSRKKWLFCRETSCSSRARFLSRIHLPPVTLSAAPPNPVPDLSYWREVEGPRECVLCHADPGSSHQNANARYNLAFGGFSLAFSSARSARINLSTSASNVAESVPLWVKSAANRRRICA